MPVLVRDRRGASLVEFALLLPVLIALLVGMLGYGQYFLFAHSVQQLANDAARATVAGLTPDERRTLALASVRRALPQLPELAPAQVTTSLVEAPEIVTVRVRFDAGRVVLFRNAFVPMPDPVIERAAAVRPGGFE